MYIHLDLSWMSHPFPVSSFVLESQHDIERVRSLGLQQLRWSRDKSMLASHDQDTPDAHATQVAELAPAATADNTPPESALASQRTQSAAESTAQRAAQRAAMRLCEQQHTEASQALRGIVMGALQRPEHAGVQAQSLARAMTGKMLGEHDLSVLVLQGHSANMPTAHGLNVSVIALLLARVMRLDEAEMFDVGVGALLHDIGKLELPSAVHHADERLTSAQMSAYRDHVRLGVLLGRRMGLSLGALQVIAQHHESADGTGYPARLNLERMSLPGRIVALANRFDELCNPQQVAHALTPHEALSKLFAGGQGRADATLLNSFIRMMGVYPAGSVVQLTDDRYAVVTHVNSSRPLKPRVLVHEPGVTREDALIVNLMDQSDLGIRRSLVLAQLPATARDCLQPSPRVAYYFEPLHPPLTPACAWM